jgi:hypothetical protein
MGFSHGECVICYLQGGGNIPAQIMQICAVCIENHRTGWSGRVGGVCMQNVAYGGTCDLCRKERIFTFNAGVCEDCRRTYSEPESEEDESDDSGDD